MDGVQNEGDSGRATASRRKNRQWVFILVVVVVVIADVAALSIKFLLTNSNTAPSGLPAGITLTQFEARVEQQVRSRTSRGFGVASAKSTRCFMGTAWKPGQQFNCFVYDSRGIELGEIDGTILPNRGKKYVWNSLWVSATSPSTTTSTSPATSRP